VHKPVDEKLYVLAMIALPTAVLEPIYRHSMQVSWIVSLPAAVGTVIAIAVVWIGVLWLRDKFN
jgi:hypothetical protein